LSKNLLPQKRRRSREIALQMLYALDIRADQSPDEALALFASMDEDEEIWKYAEMLVRGAWGERVAIDKLIRTYLTGWRPERMVAVDRAALRLALYESYIKPLIPIPVAISEAVELARTFGTEESAKFVNGVLGRIIRAVSEEAGPGIVHTEPDPDR